LPPLALVRLGQSEAVGQYLADLGEGDRHDRRDADHGTQSTT
jgi:hypothetical protein